MSGDGRSAAGGVGASHAELRLLLAHEAVLVGYGAAAESMVFADPNTSMIKARQFGEQLVAALVTTVGIGFRLVRTLSTRG